MAHASEIATELLFQTFHIGGKRVSNISIMANADIGISRKSMPPSADREPGPVEPLQQ
jgi:hypothetical protein